MDKWLARSLLKSHARTFFKAYKEMKKEVTFIEALTNIPSLKSIANVIIKNKDIKNEMIICEILN